MPSFSLSARAALNLIGPSFLGRPAVRAVSVFARRGLLGPHQAARAVELLSSHWRDRTIVARVNLGGPRAVALELDLALASCVDVLVTPRSRWSDQATMRLFEILAHDAQTILDVGANVGLFTYLAALRAPRARIVAFEPSPLLAALVRRNVATNGWADRTAVRAEGVSARPDTMVFYVRESDSESTFDATRQGTGPVLREIPVPVVALDDVLNPEGLAHIDASRTLLKIDVEGHEMRVLDGLERTLRQAHDRPAIIMEFLGRAITEERIIERVRSYGLDVYYIRSGGLLRLGSTRDLDGAHQLGQWNFLVTERPVSDLRTAAEEAGLPLDPRSGH